MELKRYIFEGKTKEEVREKAGSFIKKKIDSGVLYSDIHTICSIIQVPNKANNGLFKGQTEIYQ